MTVKIVKTNFQASDCCQFNYFKAANMTIAMIFHRRILAALNFGSDSIVDEMLKCFPLAKYDSAQGIALISQLQDYFAGQTIDFNIEIDLWWTSDFARSVLLGVLDIPYGQVLSYNQLANYIGNSGATRAVGTALASNQIPIIIPCHRIIKADGSLGQYSAGRGIEDKKFLLLLESKKN